MEALVTQEKLNTRREALVLKGFPLLALSFQTLGVFLIVPTSQPWVSRAIQGLSTPILAPLALSPLHEASSSADALL